MLSLDNDIGRHLILKLSFPIWHSDGNILSFTLADIALLMMAGADFVR
jgi:hypothetical protein